MGIGIIDYGMGNLRSVEKAINHLGFDVFVSSDPQKIMTAEKVILPGVGAFGDAMLELEKRGFIQAIKEIVNRRTPLLGICLGLQIFFEESEESAGIKGLCIFKGRVIRLRVKLKVPHIGWNQLNFPRKSSLFNGIQDNSFVYFVHSYIVVPEDEKNIIATAEYGVKITAGVEKDNIFGVQFHPEKSQSIGLKILDNFCAFLPK